MTVRCTMVRPRRRRRGRNGGWIGGLLNTEHRARFRTAA
ncbi:hypothetical protein C7S13_3233 [Burkholderia cepacia]|nr:hypothetical protein [Burkholderia cepacia]